LYKSDTGYGRELGQRVTAKVKRRKAAHTLQFWVIRSKKQKEDKKNKKKKYQRKKETKFSAGRLQALCSLG
jgi:hypothetical protein